MPELAGEGRVEKRFRVAREGQTVDGRILYRQDIQDMADTYNPEHYAGRINVEHIPGWSGEPPFNAYGDILKVEAVNENGKLCLYNTLSALPNLLSLNKKGQKIYPSVEFYTNFAGSGKAYQVGLALTDTPNSLGTQPLKFSAHPQAHRTRPNEEIFMDLGTETEQPTKEQGTLDKIMQLLTPAKPKPAEHNATQAILVQGVHTALQDIEALKQRFTAFQARIPQPAGQAPVVDVSQQQQHNPGQAVPGQPAVQPGQPAPVTLETLAQQFAALQQQFTPAIPGQPPVQPGQPGQPAPVTLETLAQQFSAMQQQFNALQTAPVNHAPPAGGGISLDNNY